MFNRGQEIVLKVEERRLFFNERDFLPLEKVVLNHPDDREMGISSFDYRRFPWVRLWVSRFLAGVLDCDVSDFNPAGGFGSQSADLSNLWKLLIFVDRDKVLEFALPKPKPPPPKPKPVVLTPPPPKPLIRPVVPSRPREPEPFEETIGFKVPLRQIRFTEGAAVVGWGGRLPVSGGFVRFKAVIKNSLIGSQLNCIKPYLEKCMGKREIAVHAVVRGRGNEVESVQAESADIAAITQELIGEVRYHYVKGELRAWRRGKGRVTTAERFFEQIEEVGFGESDTDFLVDILRARNAKHSAHIEYLAGLHDSNLVRLRLVKEPFSFPLFPAGPERLLFCLETLEGTDATYLWNFGQPPGYLAEHKPELKRWLKWVEAQLDLIHAAGRDEYLRDAPEKFRRIFHSYQETGGFEKWKNEIHEVLEQEEKVNPD